MSNDKVRNQPVFLEVDFSLLEVRKPKLYNDAELAEAFILTFGIYLPPNAKNGNVSFNCSGVAVTQNVSKDIQGYYFMRFVQYLLSKKRDRFDRMKLERYLCWANISPSFGWCVKAFLEAKQHQIILNQPSATSHQSSADKQTESEVKNG